MVRTFLRNMQNGYIPRYRNICRFDRGEIFLWYIIPIIHICNDLNYNFTISFSYFVGSILRCIRYFAPTPFAFNILLGTPFFISALTTASARFWDSSILYCDDPFASVHPVMRYFCLCLSA